MAILVALVSFILFASFGAHHIPAGDSGDLLTAAATGGVAHPPGYPLYTFLGWLFSHIPFSTVVWRIGLLSSIPHALVIVLVYSIVLRLTKHRLSAIFASLLLLANYLFFLYSVTPEVFALFDLFVVGLVWFTLDVVQSKKIKTWYLLCFVAGLSLTHHQVVLFLFPSVGFLLWQYRKHLGSRVVFFKSVFFFVLGFVPYTYVFIAARGHSIINWDHAVNFSNFIALVSRQDYGTFQSAGLYGQAPVQRLLEIKMWGTFIFMDFSLVGIVLALAGLYWLWRKWRKIFWFFVSAIAIMGPVFLFYASFPLQSRFTLATFERFLLPSYCLLAIVAGIGFSFVTTLLQKVNFSIAKTRIRFDHIVIVLLFLIVFVSGAVTVWKFIGYATDKTGEYLGMDVLTSLPHGAVLLLDRDTQLFTAQYDRYVLHVRPDIYLLHGSRVSADSYRTDIHGIFPSLRLPTSSDPAAFRQFVEYFGHKGLMFSATQYSVDSDWYWVPYGLVFRLVAKEALPEYQDMKEQNIRLWVGMHDPTKGMWGHYNHLMLSDVNDIYTSARLNFGKTLLRANDVAGALPEINAAIAYRGDTQLSEAYIYAGMSAVALKQCKNALTDFELAKQTAFTPNNDIIQYEALDWRDCFDDPSRAKPLFDQYQRLQQKNQTPLQQL